MDRDLADLYRQRCDTPSDIHQHLPNLAALVAATNAAHVIELGVREGNSTVAFLYGLERTGGTLTSVDVSEAPNIGAWPRWRYVQGDDLDPDVIGQMDQADIVLIDTVHTFDHTLAELEAYAPLVRKGGIIALHDSELVIAGTRPVTDAVEAFCAARGVGWVNDPKCNGMATIQL